jgi:hypothetical protein
MRGTIFLLGTSHPVQCGSNKCSLSAQQFREFVRKHCHFYKIRLLAEEMSNCGLANHGVTASVAQTLASELNIQYLAVDLEDQERKNLGIDDWDLGIAAAPPGTFIADKAVLGLLTEKLSNPLREYCWFARILANDSWPTLFICGANHVQSMVSLMQSVGQDVVVINDDYEP